MNALPLHEFHQVLGARFARLNGAPIVNDYGDWQAEQTALRASAGVLDFSFRSRLCLTGTDRIRFLHGQVTNDIKRLPVGHGCYAALVTAKGKMESDLNIFNLPDELLLDFEPGLAEKVSQRLEKYIVADDVQIVDVVPHYGLLSVQGPKAESVIRAIGLFNEVPAAAFASLKISEAMLGEIYLMNLPRLNASGFDLFVPNNSLGAVADKLVAAAKQLGGRVCGWQAFETVRIETGIPRFGADMDETNLPLECGLEARAVSYHKGCYIGQEVINRVHSIGHVTKELRGLSLPGEAALPARGDRLFLADKEVGYITSAIKSPALNRNIALGYVRHELGQIGTELTLRAATGNQLVKVVDLPFVR